MSTENRDLLVGKAKGRDPSSDQEDMLLNTPLMSKSEKSESIEEDPVIGRQPAEPKSVQDRVDDLYEEVGGCGLFQVFAYFAIAWGMSGPSWFIYQIGFLIQAPDQYICTYQDGTDGICTKDDICEPSAGDPIIESYIADPDDSKTLNNWQQRLDMTCTAEWIQGFIGSALFVGWCLTLLWLPAQADKRGRKKIFFLGMVIDLFMYVGLLITTNLAVMITLWVIFGAVSSIRINIGYVYLMEMLPRKAQTPVTSGWNVQEAAIYVLATIYFGWISINWFPFVVVGFVWQCISVVCLVWMPESPRYLVSVGKLDEARAAFATIAWWNRKKLVWDQRLYSETGRLPPQHAALCSQETAADMVEVVEIHGLPLKLSEQDLRVWVEQQIGELANDIVHLGLLTDNEMNSLMASRNTGLRTSNLASSRDAPLSQVCYISFNQSSSLEQANKQFERSKFHGRPIDVKQSAFAASEIVIAKDYQNMDEDDERRTASHVSEGMNEDGVPSMMYYLKQRKIVMNLLLMSVVWLSTSFGYYLLLTLINTFSKVYVTAFTSSGSEILAYILSGLFYERIGVKLSLVLSFACSTVGGILILAWGLQHDESPWFLVMFLLTKFGVTCTFNINFVANQYFFPTLFCATALGVCNFLARLFSSISFIVSELSEPYPMILFTILTAIATVASLLLQLDEKEEKQRDKKNKQVVESE